MRRPAKSEYDAYYERYISLVEADDLMGTLTAQPAELKSLFAGISEEKGVFTYEEGKWNIKEVLSHLIDGERMFSYRLLRISRGDTTPIEGFEQDGYIENAHAERRSLSELIEEFHLLREANLLQMRNLDKEDWQRLGTASGLTISALALAFIMSGHIAHHVKILKDRYLA